MTSVSHPHVIIYTTPTCPDCRALKAWLGKEGIAFEEHDLSDPETMAQAKARTGVRVAPITLVGEQVFYGTFLSQKPGLAVAIGLSSTRRTDSVTDAVDKDLQHPDCWKAYVAGPPPMVEATMRISTARGLRSEDLPANRFFTPGEASARRLSPGFPAGI